MGTGPNGTIHIVQLDVESPDTGGIDPFELQVHPTVPSATAEFSVLRRASDELIEAWDKLSVLREFAPAYEGIEPSLFALPLEELRSAAGGTGEQELLRDLSKLGKQGLMARLSARRDAAKEYNLPRSEAVSPVGLLSFMLSVAAQRASEGYDPKDYAFVIHRFIESRASAWARYELGSQLVEVHGNWGIADALNFYPFDQWDVYPTIGEVTEYAAYKSHYLWPTEDGQFLLNRTRNEVARHQCIQREQLLDIGRKTKRIGDALGQSVQVMWFIGAQTADGQRVSIPWYRVPPQSDESDEQPRTFRRIRITSSRDLQNLLPDPTVPHVLEIAPVADAIREKDLLTAVASFSRQYDVPVAYLGSPLSHAYFQLRKEGCKVTTLGERRRLKRRHIRRFNKLVRDGIPDRITTKQEAAFYRRLDQPQAIKALIGKLFEEAQEVLSADKTTIVEELADLFEVWRGITFHVGADLNDVIDAADRKKQSAGGFESAFFLQETSLLPSQRSGHRQPPLRGIDDVHFDRDEEVILVPFAYLGNQTELSARSVGIGGGLALHIRLSPGGLELRIVNADEQLQLPFPE